MIHLRYTAMLILGSLLLTCVCADSVTVSWKYTCHSGANIISDNSTAKCTATAATENDAKAASFCFGPNNAVANNTFTEYGCGKCPKKAKKGACLTCAAWNSTADGSDNSNCNTWQPIFTYSCYHNEASVVCNNGTGVLRKDIHCWGPKPTYTGNNENLTKSGCGTCEAAHAENSTPGWDIGDCATCDYNNCNSAATMLSFLGVFTPFFWLCSRN